MGVEVAIGAAIIGGAMSAYGSYRQGKAQQRAANQQAEAQRRRAQELLRRTDLELVDLEQETSDFVGEQKLQIVSNNVSLGTTTSMQIIADTYQKSAEERLRKLEEARWQAQELETGAQASIEQGKSFRRAGNIGAASSVVGTFSDIYSIGRAG